MRFLTADYLYPLNRDPIKEGVLQISSKGEIIDVYTDRNDFSQDSLEFFEGVLCPGFVNAHCHLELSHLQGEIDKGSGLVEFISGIKKRNCFSKDSILDAIMRAENQMVLNGIVGVGDICNTTDTIIQKKRGNLNYYNFIEAFGVKQNKTDQIITDIKFLKDQFIKNGLRATITPHSPYSVPPRLMQDIKRNFTDEDELFSVHMQETSDENILFKNKSGKFFTWLTSNGGCTSIWDERNNSTDILKELDYRKVLLVHNTFAAKKDIKDQFYCTCPKANLFIENTLPDYSIFKADKLCVGTDSLASNNSLSILEELKIIQKNSNFDLNTLLKISAKNGAEALGFKDLGTFERGKKPGVNLINELSMVEIIA